MNYKVIEDENEYEEYETFNKKYGNVFQSMNWLKSNGVNDFSIIVGKNNNEIYIAGLFFTTKRTNSNDLSLYFPRGPSYKEKNIEYIEGFFYFVEDYVKDKNINYIEYELNYDKKECEVIEKYFRENGYIAENPKFWNYNWMIDIGSIDSEGYLRSLKQKTRYNIEYSKRKGVKVLIDNSEESIEKFYDLLKITSNRDEFKIKRIESYRNLFKYFGENVKLFWTYKDSILLSSAILIIYGNVAYYMYGASSNGYRNLQSTYLLQFSMIDYSISKKCDSYYMGGVGYIVNNKDYFSKGLYDFKSKFGGYMKKELCCYVKEIRS